MPFGNEMPVALKILTVQFYGRDPAGFSGADWAAWQGRRGSWADAQQRG